MHEFIAIQEAAVVGGKQAGPVSEMQFGRVVGPRCGRDSRSRHWRKLTDESGPVANFGRKRPRVLPASRPANSGGGWDQAGLMLTCVSAGLMRVSDRRYHMEEGDEYRNKTYHLFLDNLSFCMGIFAKNGKGAQSLGHLESTRSGMPITLFL